MYCPQCGKQAAGKFCWNCGAPLQMGARAQPGPAVTTTPSVASDWQNEIDYETLIHNPNVRNLLAKPKPPESGMTGEEFLESFSKILSSSIALDRVGAIAQEAGGRLGVHTVKTRSEIYRQPIGRIYSVGFVRPSKGWL